MSTPRELAPQTGSINDVVRNLLDRRFNAVADGVLEAVARNTQQGIIAQRMGELQAEAQRLAEAGERLTPSNPILRALVADLEDNLLLAARRIDRGGEQILQDAINSASTLTRQLALPGMTNQQIDAVGLRWNSVDPEAVRSAVGYLDSAAWDELLAEYPISVTDRVRSAALRGLARGWNPMQTAEVIKAAAEKMTLSQAREMMRTLQLTAYRDAVAINQNANIAIAEQVIRIGARDERICLACLAQYGDVIWDSERDAGSPIPRVNDHHNGRCTSVMVVRGRSVTVQTGEAWFNSLNDSERYTIAGEAAFNALQAGAVTLRDFVMTYDDKVFGEMVGENSLEGILGDDAEQYYKRNQK